MADTIIPLVSRLLRVFVFLVAIGVLVLACAIAWNHPPLRQSPGFSTRLKTYLTTNVAETRHDSAFPELRLRRYDVSPERLFAIARNAIEHLGWEVAEIDAHSRTVHAVATTRLWRFKDDVIVSAQQLSANDSTLYVRSASRIGKVDLGANVRHVLDLLEEVDQALAKPKP